MFICHFKLNFVFTIITGYLFMSTIGTADRKLQCLNDIIEWCNNKSDTGNGISNFAFTDITDCGIYHHITCEVSSYGTYCKKNGYPWIDCGLNHEVKYKGTVLQKDSPKGIDDEICYTARKVNINATVVLDMVNKIVDNVESNVEEIVGNISPMVHSALSHVDHTLKGINSMLSKPCFPFCGYHFSWNI